MQPTPDTVPNDLSAEMNAEIDQAMAALDQKPKAAPPSQGKPAIRGPRVVEGGREKRKGKVVSVGPTDVFVEFGPKDLGVVERTQYPNDEAEWELLEPGQTIEGKVVGVNKGGLELEVAGGHRAFLPASQVGLDRIEDLSVMMGQKIACQVERIDRRGKGNIVLSRRQLLLEERNARRDKLRETLKEGQTIDGTVRKIMAFGAFVDLGGLDGLVHISDMTHERATPSEKNVGKYVKEGQNVRVIILKTDWENNRISLGMKQLQEDPFLTATNQIKEGEEVTGRVKSITEFGCFVEVAPGVEGLVHISELDWRRVNRVEDVVKADEIIKVKVLKVEPGSRKVSLSLKQTKPAPERPAGAAGGKGREPKRTAEDIAKEDPAFRRLKEKFGNQKLKGGF